MILIVILYALFAGTFSLGKLILGYTQPFFLVGSRMSIAGLILLGYQWFTNRRHFKVKNSHWLLFAQAMMFTIYIPYLLRFWGLAYMPSSKACLLYNFGPFVTFLFSYLIYSEKVTIKKIIGMIIGFLGLIPIITKSGSCAPEFSSSFLSLPDLAIILSTSSQSYGWLVIHRLIKEKNYSPIFANGISMTGGGLLALATSFIVERQTGFVTDLVPFIGILAVIIIVSNLLCHNLYASLLKRYSPTLISFASFLAPIFAALYGWIFLHEAITWQFILSACIIFFGLGLFYQDELKHGGAPLLKPDQKLASPSFEEVEIEQAS